MTRQAYRALVLAALPGTQAEIRDRTGLTLATVSRWITDIRIKREAHIGAWFIHPNGGPVAAVWHLGPGEPAPRPKIMTDRQRTRKSCAALRKSGEWQDVLARNRAKYAAARKPARRDPLLAAFYSAPVIHPPKTP